MHKLLHAHLQCHCTLLRKSKDMGGYDFSILIGEKVVREGQMLFAAGKSIGFYFVCIRILF